MAPEECDVRFERFWVEVEGHDDFEIVVCDTLLGLLSDLIDGFEICFQVHDVHLP